MAAILITSAYLVIEFVAFSVIGWVWESILCSLARHRLVLRGMLCGPVCPTYGFVGVAALHLFLSIPSAPLLFLTWLLVLLIAGYGLATAIESVARRSFWSYDDMPANVRGRACLPAAAGFAAFAVLVRHFGLYATRPFLAGMSPDRLCDIALLAIVLLLVDVVVSTRRWETDARRSPADVAVVVCDAPGSDGCEDLAEQVRDRVQIDWLADPWHAGKRRGGCDVPPIRIVSAKRLASGKLLVMARIGAVDSLLSVIRRTLARLARPGCGESREARIIRHAIEPVWTNEDDDGDDDI